jgi:DNA-binding CsgD family transcriptional regulator
MNSIPSLQKTSAVQLESYDALLLDLYGAVSQPGRLQGFLQRFADLMHAASAALITPELLWEAGGIWLTLDPRQAGSYLPHVRKYLHDNPWVAAADRLRRAGKLAAADTAWGDDDLDLPAAEFERSDFFCDYLNPLDIYRFAEVRRMVPGLNTCFQLTAFRRKDQPPFDAAEKSLVTGVARHVQLALEQAEHWKHSSIRAEIDLIPTPLWLYGFDRKPRIYNRAAASLIAEGRIVNYRQGSLFSDIPEVDAVLDAMVQAVDPQRPATSSRRVATPFGLVRLLVGGLPRSVNGSEAFAFRLAINVVPSAGDPHPYAAFGFTPAEQRLASLLVAGKTLREAAVACGVKYSTVRSQLNSLFQKVGVQRQAELIDRLRR